MLVVSRSGGVSHGEMVVLVSCWRDPSPWSFLSIQVAWNDAQTFTDCGCDPEGMEEVIMAVE